MFPITEATSDSLKAIGGGKERKTTLKTFARTMTVVLGLFGMRPPNSLSEQLITTLLIGLTVEAIDSTGLKITVQADGSRDAQSMPVVNSAVVKGIRGGDRVSLGLDQEGRVVNLRKLPPILTEAPEPRG